MIIVLFFVRGVFVRLSPRTSQNLIPLEFSIRENAKERGLNFVHKPVNVNFTNGNIIPWIQFIGASVAVADLNGDGFMDVIMIHNDPGEPPAIFINDTQGNFNESASLLGFENVDPLFGPQRVVVFDCDNDGHKDILFTTYSCPVLYHQEKNRFVPMADAGFSKHCELTHAVGILDADDDGVLDVITAGFHSYDIKRPLAMTPIPESLVDSNNGGRAVLWQNDGKCHFSLRTQAFPTASQLFYHSVGLGDFRGTGETDVWISSDFNNDRVFFKTAGDAFESSEVSRSHSSNGMNSEVIYLNNDPTPFVFVTHVYKPGYLVAGNTFWHYEAGRFQNRALDFGVNRCGWAWSGRAIDLDNSGNLSLAVANGGVRGELGNDFWHSYSSTMIAPKVIARNARFWQEMRGKDLSGREQDCLFFNHGGRFIDIASQIGFDQGKLEGRAVAVIDSNNSGAQNIIVANQNGPAYFYTISPPTENTWIGFDLESMRSNREAIGTRVTITAGKHVYRREKYLTNSFGAQSDPRMHFGLGNTQSINSVEIRWPSGRVQTLGQLELNRYHHITEQ
jgi:hypothetical protein